MADRSAVNTMITVDEPSYDALAAELENDPGQLLALLETGDRLVAARAIHVAGAIARNSTNLSEDTKGTSLAQVCDVVEKGSHHKDPTVRVAAAIAAAALPKERGATITSRLLADDDIGVQKSALEGVPQNLTAEVVAALEKLATSQSEIAKFAQHLLAQHPRD